MQRTLQTGIMLGSAAGPSGLFKAVVVLGGVVSISPAVAGEEGTGELSSVCRGTGLSSLASASFFTAPSNMQFRFVAVLGRSLRGAGLDQTGRLCLTSAREALG